MTTALAEREPTTLAPTVTTDQIELIKRTVANGATADELKLYLYDCARQGVHPLDRLVHFTKRKGKYTPITSIDFMRTRAADTNEYAGSDDAVFTLGDERIEAPHTATVTVYRLVQGHLAKFTATARWAEYYPGDGDISFMWRKMPHTMLAKCAEALALRKGFPRQLAGLYAKEEMDQAGESQGGYTVTPQAPQTGAVQALPAGAPSVPNGVETSGRYPIEGELGHPDYHAVQNHRGTPAMPEGALIIREVKTSPTKNPNVVKAFVTFSTGEVATTIKTPLITLCEQLCQEQIPITVDTTQTKWGIQLDAVHRVPLADDARDSVPEPVDVDDIPFAWLLPLVLPVIGGLL